VAIKSIDRDAIPLDERDMVSSEVEVMLSLSHNRCMRVLEVYSAGVTSHDAASISHAAASLTDAGMLYLVLPIMRGGELFSHLQNKGPLSEDAACSVFVQVAEALEHIHSKGIVHRDIKAENIMYEGDPEAGSAICLADFGVAAQLPTVDGGGEQELFDDMALEDIYGTAGYVAPEVSEATDNGEGYGRPCDMWAAGVLIYLMVGGQLPYEHEDLGEYVPEFEVTQLFETVPVWANISDETKQMVKSLLIRNPAERVTAAQVLALPHISSLLGVA